MGLFIKIFISFVQNIFLLLFVNNFLAKIKKKYITELSEFYFNKIHNRVRFLIV